MEAVTYNILMEEVSVSVPSVILTKMVIPFIVMNAPRVLDVVQQGGVILILQTL
jgi:hypothetical protein